MKKALALLLIIGLLFSNALTLYANAAEIVVFEVLAEQTQNQAVYSIRISDDSCISALTLEFTYDDTNMKIVSSSCSSLLDLGMSTVNDKSLGKVIMAFVSAEQLKSSGEIMSIIFRVTDGKNISEIKTHLTIKNATDAKGKNISVSAVQAYKSDNTATGSSGADNENISAGTETNNFLSDGTAGKSTTSKNEQSQQEPIFNETEGTMDATIEPTVDDDSSTASHRSYIKVFATISIVLLFALALIVIIILKRRHGK